MTDNGPLAGRIALVTGGSGGIGAAICRALAAAGAGVAVGYNSAAAAAESLVAELYAVSGGAPVEPGSVADASGGTLVEAGLESGAPGGVATPVGPRFAAFGADLSDPAAPARLVEDVSASLGPVDILVANHGLARQLSYEDVDAEAFDRTVATNLRAPFLLARAVLPAMRARGYGRILFMSSTAALRGGIVGPDYAASKAGLHGMTHFLASRVAADGVTVNALAPGLIETPMLPGDPSELARTVPVGRVGRPGEVADMALAILRNGYLTNHVISVDGGLHPA